MHRFFLRQDYSIVGERIVFPSVISHQIARVLHLQVDDRVIVVDEGCRDLLIELKSISTSTVQGIILGSAPNQNEPGVRVHLFLSLTQREKFEWTLQKCTEVGATNFTPVITARCLPRLNEVAPTKIQRWQDIIREAAEQSGRGIIPGLNPPISLSNALRGVDSKADIGCLLWEEEAENGLYLTLQKRRATAEPREILLFVGPEGGFQSQEVEQACLAGLIPVTLGKRILRTETAAFAATIVALMAYGDFS